MESENIYVSQNMNIFWPTYIFCGSTLLKMNRTLFLMFVFYFEQIPEVQLAWKYEMESFSQKKKTKLQLSKHMYL